MNKSLAALLGAVAAAASLASADLVLAQAKAGKDAAKEAPKAYSGPEAHQACAKAGLLPRETRFAQCGGDQDVRGPSFRAGRDRVAVRLPSGRRPARR